MQSFKIFIYLCRFFNSFNRFLVAYYLVSFKQFNWYILNPCTNSAAPYRIDPQLEHTSNIQEIAFVVYMNFRVLIRTMCIAVTYLITDFFINFCCKTEICLLQSVIPV